MDNKLKLNALKNSGIPGLLNFDGSTYVSFDSVDASKNKVLLFDMWLDSSTIYESGAVAYPFIFNKDASNDIIALVSYSAIPGKIGIAVNSDTISRTSIVFNITNDMLNKILHCELRKAEKHLHWFKINDVSVVSTGNIGTTVLVPTGIIGQNLKNATIWNVALYTYDTSQFVTGSLMHSWKGYPYGNTATAWVDSVGTTNGTISTELNSTLSTRTLLGVDTSSYTYNYSNKLILNFPNTITFESETTSLLARMSTQPSDALALIINTAIKDLKTYGLWNKLDFLAVYAMHTEQAALLDWKNYLNHTNVNSMHFVAYKGFDYDTSATGVYVTSNFDPSTKGVNFTLNDAMMGVWQDSSGDTFARPFMGSRSSGTYHTSAWYNANQLAGTINTGDTAIQNLKSPFTFGLTLIDRESSTAIRGIMNASIGAAVTQNSVRLSQRAFWIRGAYAYTSNGFSMNIFRASMAGAHLTSAEHTNLYNIMNTYITAVDAL